MTQNEAIEVLMAGCGMAACLSFIVFVYAALAV